MLSRKSYLKFNISSLSIFEIQFQNGKCVVSSRNPFIISFL